MWRTFRIGAIVVGLCVALGASAGAATYYVATDGADANPGTSAQPWATFAHAVDRMSGGDTLLIRDGSYDQAIDHYYGEGIPTGAPGAYTVIRAEHDWGVRVTRPLRIGGNDPSYIQIQGIHFMVNAVGVSGHHLKLIRCSFRGNECTGNTTVIDAGTGSSYVLFEECFAYGCGRYKFMAYGDQNIPTENIIFRRCVARHDFHEPDPGWGRQSATFTSYDAHNVLFQNCISVDSGDDDPSLYGMLYGGIWLENKQTTPRDNSARIQGCIFLNLAGLAAINDPKNNGVREIENTVIWHTKGGYGGGVISGTPSLLLRHMTVGDIWGTFQDESYAWGTAAYGGEGFTSEQIRDSVMTGCHSYGIADYMTSASNVYFANAADFGHTWGTPAPVPGPQDRFVDPQLKYLCRVEDGSPLKGTASDGGDVGATILKRYGVSGTLWGDPGYDQLTDEPLWPFPNEAVIKQTLAAWDGPNLATRGFCAPGAGLYGGPITLTSYIWEYLGYACPAEICGAVTPLPQLGIAGAGVGEGDAGTSQATFEVALSEAP